MPKLNPSQPGGEYWVSRWVTVQVTGALGSPPPAK